MANKNLQFAIPTARKYLGTVSFSASQRQELQVQNGIPKDYFVHSFLFDLEYRLTITGGTTSGTVVAEAGQNLIERIEISGNHKVLGDFTPYLLQGSHAFQLADIWDGYPHQRSLGGLAGAVGTYDIKVRFPVVMPPRRVKQQEQLFYLLDAPLWNTLQLYVDWGAAASLISGGDRTLALSAFGSATGNPTLNITRVIAKLANNRGGLKTIPIKRGYKSIKIEATQAGQYIADLNRGNFIRDFSFVTGTRATGGSLATKGDNFLTLSDALVTRAQIKRDDIPQRDVFWQDNQEMEAASKQLGFTWPTGYNMIDFCENETLLSAYDTRALALNNLRYELWGDITGAVDQRLHIITDEIAQIPLLSA